MRSGKVVPVVVTDAYSAYEKGWYRLSTGKIQAANELFSSKAEAIQHQRMTLDYRRAKLVSQRLSLDKFEQNLLKEAG